MVQGRLRAAEERRPRATGTSGILDFQAVPYHRSVLIEGGAGTMLARLSIRDIVLIDQLDLEFPRGLTILTGETGAGKSILLDALSLALGARGDGGLVRAGAAQGQVTAVFEPPADHPVHALLAAQDLPGEGELILRRVQMADGRTRAYVNDQ